MLLLTVGGLGHIRPAPGTWGSLPMPLIAFAAAALWEPAWMAWAVTALVGVVFAVACVRFGSYGEAQLGKKDPGAIVADEMAGQAIALLFLPWRFPQAPEDWWYNALLAGIAFIAFRVFDITKPPPCKGLQRYRGGWGILVDDLIAGVYAGVVVNGVAHFVI